MKFLQAHRIAPYGTPHSAASHLGLFYLPMSHKRDAKLKGVNILCVFLSILVIQPNRTVTRNACL